MATGETIEMPEEYRERIEPLAAEKGIPWREACEIIYAEYKADLKAAAAASAVEKPAKPKTKPAGKSKKPKAEG
jgi:hypothetical protein